MKKHEMADAAEEMSAHYREKDYDLTNPNDLKQALTLAVAAWRDYCHYNGTLSSLIDNFDESIEHYDTASWFCMGLSPDNADELAAEGMSALNTACIAFDKLSQRAEDNFVALLKKTLAAPPATQQAVLGREYPAGQGNFDARIEELLEAMTVAEYHHAIPQNYGEFLSVMSEVWPGGE